MGFPSRRDNWHSGAVPAQKAFIAVAAAIAAYEPVTIAAASAQYSVALRMVRALQPQPEHRIRVVEISQDDSWFRDTAPLFARDASGSVVGVAFEFNAWGGHNGGCYSSWDLDNLVDAKICQMENLPWMFAA